MRIGTLLLVLPLSALGCGPCGPVGNDAGPVPEDAGPPSRVVVINELLAKNDTVNADERGDFDDWIELYNPGDEAVDLSGYGLSDKLAEPRRHVFEDGTELAAGAFLLIWADDDPSQGPLHTVFKLSGDGEEVVLTDPEGALIDRVSFGPQLADVSEGRFPDGDESWGRLLSPTPGASNLSPSDAGVVRVDAGPTPRISEVSPAPGAPATDLSGALVDVPWVELSNPNAESVTLAGLWLSTNAFTPQWRLSDTMPELPAGGFAVIFLDATDTPPDHAGITIVAGAELALFDNAGDRVDLVVVDTAPEGLSLSRTGDAELSVTVPTPGAANGAPVDAGVNDGGANDAGLSDAGLSDAGSSDGGAVDAGTPDAGDGG